MLHLTSQQAEFIIREYKKRDERQILSLFKHIFKTSKEYNLWKWEFLQNPYGTQIMLCEHKGQGIIAQCAALPCPLFLQNQTYMGAQLVDCMCKPEYRTYIFKKKGLFALTVKEFFNTFTGPKKDIYLYGFPGVRHFKLGKILLGYKKTRHLLEASISHLNKKSYFFSLQSINSELHQLSKTIYKLALNDAYKLKFCILKEPKYLNWRYLNSPKPYSVLLLKNILGNIKALGVIIQNSDNIKLVDFIGLSHFKIFLNLLWNEFKKPISLWFPQNSLLHKILQTTNANIFTPSIPIIPGGKTFWSKLDWHWANQNFYYCMGDTDLV